MYSTSIKAGLPRFTPAFFLSLSLLFFLAGCAGKPWSGKFGKDEVKTNTSLIDRQIKAHETCPATLDAEAAVTWKTALGTKAFSGYLQMQLPASVKFVTTNPLGQPLFALVSNGKGFSSVNTLTRQYISGSLTALALRNDIPVELLTGNWGTWLSSRITGSAKEHVTGIRKDTAGRGIWVVVDNPKSFTKGQDYILVDPTGSRVLLRVLMNTAHDPIARIRYGGWQLRDKCELPTEFTISDLPMGAEISLHLSDIITDKVFDKDNFTLMPPPGYFIQVFL